MRIQSPGFTYAQYNFKLAPDFDSSKFGEYAKKGGLPVSELTKVKSGSDSTAWNSTAVSKSSASVSSGLTDAQAEFKMLAEMSPAQRLRYNMLKSKGLDEASLQAMPAEQRQGIENEIAKAVKAQLGIDPSSQTAANDAPTNVSSDKSQSPDTSAVDRISKLIESRNAFDSAVA